MKKKHSHKINNSNAPLVHYFGNVQKTKILVPSLYLLSWGQNDKTDSVVSLCRRGLLAYVYNGVSY